MARTLKEHECISIAPEGKHTLYTYAYVYYLYVTLYYAMSIWSIYRTDLILLFYYTIYVS